MKRAIITKNMEGYVVGGITLVCTARCHPGKGGVLNLREKWQTCGLGVGRRKNGAHV